MSPWTDCGCIRVFMISRWAGFTTPHEILATNGGPTRARRVSGEGQAAGSSLSLKTLEPQKEEKEKEEK